MLSKLRNLFVILSIPASVAFGGARWDGVHGSPAVHFMHLYTGMLLAAALYAEFGVPRRVGLLFLIEFLLLCVVEVYRFFYPA